MEILRPIGNNTTTNNNNGRGRFGTFDFFGMNQTHTTTNRQRNQSTDSFIDLFDNNNNSHRHSTSSLFHDPIVPTTTTTTITTTGRRRGSYSQGGPVVTTATTTAVIAAGTGGGGTFRKERLGSMDVFATQYRKNTDTTTTRSHNGEGFMVGPTTTNTTTAFTTAAEPYLLSPAIIDDEDGGERYLYDEFGIVTLSHRVEYYGPFHIALESATYTPPTSWAEASRRIIPTDIMTKLERRIQLYILTGKLTISTPSSVLSTSASSSVSPNNLQWNLDQISLYVHRPLEGGVISLYVKDTPKEKWMEHTFQSAHCAAQFQLDLLAYQILGRTIKHIFEALNMIHQGSIAYDGPELVLHDDHREGNNQGRGVIVGGEEDGPTSKPVKSINATRCVAWDDAMRAMSSIPTVRIALERLWLSHRHPSDIASSPTTTTTTASSVGGRKLKKTKHSPEVHPNAPPIKETETSVLDCSILTEEYVGKRLLLGPLDFFRLFVPALPDTAIPEGESNRGRMEQLLSWRKRVARAAVLARAYTRARRVVNLGWKLSPWYKLGESSSSSSSSSDDLLTQRLAYDGNEDNNFRDTTAKNEIYEASVSRDVLCYVRPFDFMRDVRPDNLVLSPYQAYSHVGTHYFKISGLSEMAKVGDGRRHLVPSHDPVAMFPSLQRMMVENPQLDFLVLGLTLQNQTVMKYDLFVRSLAKSIDPQFDRVVSILTDNLCLYVCMCVCV
jgi:hypothetical protein